jgi:glucose/arabinose dehydrogenase
VRTGGTGGSVSTGGTGGSSSTGGAGGARPVDAATGSGGAGGGAVDANRADSAPAGGRPDTGSVAAMCPGGGAFPTLRQTAVTNVSAPIHLVGHPAEPGVLYILERGGNVRIMRDGVLQPQPFFTVSPVETGSERGALSLALHPAFNENGRIFVFFTQPDSTIEEWKRMTPTSATKVKEHYRYAHSAGNHQGGNLAFGSDGMLYFSLGDNASGGNASNPASRYGKIMRINPDTSMPADGNLNGYTWAYGLRNPWRISFDRMTGDLYIADVGQNTQEEINFEPKGMGGRNYGWPGAEGNLGSGGVRPVHVYDRSVGKSITGGYVYRGKKYPCLSGHYFYGDYDSTSVRSFMVKDGMATDHRTHAGLSGNAGGGIYSFGEDGNGELYILRGGGRVTRIDAE